MQHLYFAYGSNLNVNDLQSRFPAAAHCHYRPFRAAQLYDYRLNFNYYSVSRGCGALNLTPSLGCVVNGYLFEVDEHALEILDRKEGHPGYYQRVPVTVFCDGKPYAAITYIARPERVGPFCPPSEDYVSIVEEGLRAFKLCRYDLRQAARGRRAGLVTGLFVYGTLMREQPLSGYLPAEELHCCVLASTLGSLFDLGSYPGLIDGPERVQGEFLQVRNIRRTLRTLDRIEGFAGHDCGENLYTRRLVTCDLGDRLRTGWAYFYCGSVHPGQHIESGSWRAHQGLEPEFLARLVRAHGDEATLAEGIAHRGPFPMVPEARRRLIPLADALASGFISERWVAQASERWTVLCHSKAFRG